MKIAKRICQTSRPVVALGKRFFYRQIQMSRDDAYRLLTIKHIYVFTCWFHFNLSLMKLASFSTLIVLE